MRFRFIAPAALIVLLVAAASAFAGGAGLESCDDPSCLPLEQDVDSWFWLVAVLILAIGLILALIFRRKAILFATLVTGVVAVFLGLVAGFYTAKDKYQLPEVGDNCLAHLEITVGGKQLQDVQDQADEIRKLLRRDLQCSALEDSVQVNQRGG